MKNFIQFIKQSLKLSIGLYLLIFVFVFAVLYLWTNYEKNQQLEKRLKKLEEVNDSLSVTPDQHFTKAKIKIKDGNLDSAIRILQYIQNRYPQWRPTLVKNSINEILIVKQNIEKNKLKLFSNLENINNKISEPVHKQNSVPAPHVKQPVFRKFEYEDRKVFPLRTSNTGHKRKIKKHDSKNISIAEQLKLDAKKNKDGFKKFEYEDLRYKNNKPPVKIKHSNSKKTKSKIKSKQDTLIKKFEYEDIRYKVKKKK